MSDDVLVLTSDCGHVILLHSLRLNFSHSPPKSVGMGKNIVDNSQLISNND